jgi:hypothetical protein
MKVFLGILIVIALVFFGRWLDRDKSRDCYPVVNEVYQKRLDEALSDQSVWQIAGATSAQDYAMRSARLAESLCNR